MESRKFVTVFSILMALVLLAGSASLSWGAPPELEPAPPPGPDTYLIDAPPSPESPGRTDVAMHGTMWKPQIPSGVTVSTVGWGTIIKKKTAAGGAWFHVGVPLITRLEDRLQKISKVEFCGKSTDGTKVRPTRIDLWGNDVMFKSQVIGWPADNAYHCVDVVFNPAVWQPTLGVSVHIQFDNLTDAFTLYKAWVLLVD